MENPGLDLVGPAPIGDRVEVIGQGCIPEDLGFLVLGIRWEREGIVGGSPAEEDECRITQVLAELRRGGGRGGRGGDGGRGAPRGAELSG